MALARAEDSKIGSPLHVTNALGTGTRAASQARLQPIMPPSRESAS